MRKWITAAMLIALAGAAQAQVCDGLGGMRAEQTPPELVSIVRACAAARDHEGAIGVFLGYSAYLNFDVQRVRDQSAHAVVPELNGRVFAGYAPDVIKALREVVNRMRAPGSEEHAKACAALRKVGMPVYRPDYMIRRGEEIPLKTANDWIVEGFDGARAWERVLVELNGCPAG